MSTGERLWARRLRWRLRGAWQWPTFAVLTIADGLILHVLPPIRAGVELIPAIIVASFANLLLLGAIAPWVARRLVQRHRRTRSAGGPAGPPSEVLADRSATYLMCAATVGLVAAGLGNRPVIVSETEDTEKNARIVRSYVFAHGTDEVKRNYETANTIRLEEGYFRTCVALDDRRRAWCLFVDVDSGSVRRDPSSLPNREFVGRGTP